VSGVADGDDDLISQLRSDRGPAVRQSVLEQLSDLELRVTAALRAGMARGDYQPLESALLAVRAGRDTLNRLNLQQTQATGDSVLQGIVSRRP